MAAVCGSTFGCIELWYFPRSVSPHAAATLRLTAGSGGHPDSIGNYRYGQNRPRPTPRRPGSTLWLHKCGRTPRTSSLRQRRLMRRCWSWCRAYRCICWRRGCIWAAETALTPALSQRERELYRGGFGFSAVPSACRKPSISPNQSPLPPGEG